MSECKFLYSHLWFRIFYPGFEYLKYYTPGTSELTIISINLHKTVDSALQSAYKWEVAFHHGMAKLQPKIGHRLRRLKKEKSLLKLVLMKTGKAMFYKREIRIITKNNTEKSVEWHETCDVILVTSHPILVTCCFSATLAPLRWTEL